MQVHLLLCPKVSEIVNQVDKLRTMRIGVSRFPRMILICKIFTYTNTDARENADSRQWPKHICTDESRVRKGDEFDCTSQIEQAC